MLLHRGIRHWLTVASAFLLAAAATAGAVLHESGAAAAKASATSAAGAAAAGRVLSFGVDYSDTLPWESDASLAASLDDAVDLGAGWIRVDLAWEDYQQTSAAFAPDFARFDRVVHAADARGLHVLATIDFPPVWARAKACAGSPSCPPAEPSQYARFAREAAERYAPMGVHDWEIWNEPNIQSWAPKPDPAAYAALLHAAATAIHRADPKGFVLLGGLAASPSHPGYPYVAPADFISAVAAHGGLAGVGAIGYHPYPNPDVAASATVQAIADTPDNMVSALSRAGAPNTPIWITETGYSAPEKPDAQNTAAAVVRRTAAQAQIARDVVPVLARTSNVAAVFWFCDQDQPSVNLFYGLRTAAGARRPDFAALQQAIAANLKGRG